MKNKSSYIAAAAAVLVLLGLFLRTFSPSPSPMPQPYAGPLPSATPPNEMNVLALVGWCEPSGCGIWLPWGLVLRAARVFDGRSFGEAPAGRLAYRYWFGRDIGKQFRTLPFPVRAITFYGPWQPAVDQLKAAEYDQKSLRPILLTHSHWDHVSGLPDFPGVPVWVTAQEHELIRKRRHGFLQTL